MSKAKQAVDFFFEGYGCCQSVVAPFAQRYGLSTETALRLGAGFGGGMGRLRMTCGAASALVMLTGLEHGQTRGADREGKAECYRVVQQLLEEFRQKNGSLICAELLGEACKDIAQRSYVPSARTPEYYKRRPCAAKVECAADIFERHLAEHPKLPTN